MLHSVILDDSVNFFSRSFSQMTRGRGYQTTGHRSMGPSSFRKQSAGRACLGTVVMREQRVQEDLRKQQWLHQKHFHPMHSLTHSWPRLLQQPSVCMAPYSSQRKTGVWRPGHWGWLAAPWQWAPEMSLLLPAEPSFRQCQIRGGTYWFPQVLSP